MTKRARKRQPTQTPPEWIDLLTEHDQELTRIRMLWRRGGGRYRPLIPVNLALEDLEALDFEEWEELELDETHFEWTTLVDESPDQRERRLADAARELWATAIAWTRAKGPVCDLQLRGYGGGEEILFEDGKRCNLSGEHSRYDDSGQERATVDDTMRAMIGDERGAWHQMDRVKDSLINRLADDRERLFGHLEKTTAAAPTLIDDARQILDRAIEFQQRHFEDYVSRAGGRRELEANAFAEYQKTTRTNNLLAFLKDGIASAGAALPMAVSLFEAMTGQQAQTLPKFACAQQAFAYLHLSVDPERLMVCFPGTPEEKRKKGKQAVALFDELSKRDDEAGMLGEYEWLVRDLLSSQQFRQAATPEEGVAAQFVIGRAAILRVVYQHGEA